MTAQAPALSRAIDRSPVFYGWVIWIVATIGIIASAPGQAFTATMFIDEYIHDFYGSAQIGHNVIDPLFGEDAFIAGADMGRTTVSTIFGVSTFLAALALTYVGRMVDKYGNRRIGFLVTVAMTVVLILQSFVIGPITLFFGFIALRFLGQGSMFLVSSTAIAQWWRKRRGWVMGLALVGFALFQAVYLTFLQNTIQVYGWRMTWVILGVVMGLFVVPVWWFFMRDRPEKYGLLPDGLLARPINATQTMEVDLLEEDNWTLAEARRTGIFWVFLAGRFFTVLCGSGLVIHMVSMFTRLGHPEIAVAQTYGLLAIVNAICTFGLGRFVSRIRPGLILAIQLACMVATLSLSLIMTETWMLTLYAITFGIVMSIGGTFENNVWADLFGRLHNGAIRGFATTSIIIGSSIGPILFGLVYDTTGSYTLVIYAAIAAAFIPMTLSLISKRPVRREATA